jgi:2-polyprenyl-3-methyl-5-hydroxy-6-metoxy-1,4-benzoquinol methylase
MRVKGSLIWLYVRLHKSRSKRYKRGGCIQRYVSDISEIINEIPTRSILDYGCGGGKQYTEDAIHEAWKIQPVLFDPGVPGLDELPAKTFDGVICTGVLEHIPEEEIDGALANLVRYARMWVFIVVGLKRGNKQIYKGKLAHVTLKPAQWWQDKIENAFARRAKVWLKFE